MKLNPIQSAAAEQFSRQSDRYGSSHILARTDDVERALRQIDLPPGAEVLDVASGGGHTALALARQGCVVTLTDVAAAMVEKATALLRGQGFEATGHIGPAEALDLPAAAFDLVTCRVAAHHFSDVPAFLHETSRVLREGGWFLLIDGSVSSHEPAAEAWLHRVEKLRDPSHHRLLNDLEWRSAVAAAGLEVGPWELTSLEQPDLEWYFETANTPPENRDAVRREVAEAPAGVRSYLRLAESDGRISWWWPRLTLVARKISPACS